MAEPLALQQALAACVGEPLAGQLSQTVADAAPLRHGHLANWQTALAALPDLPDKRFDASSSTVQVICPAISDAAREQLVVQLQALIPWRKGPFEVAGVFVNTEWQSSWKWDRLIPHLQPLTGRQVLDVGCGSGYHLWRMRAAGARAVLGIDPGLLFFHQFRALAHYADDLAVQYLPLPLEAMPAGIPLFDTVFSMGVLYHRRDPLQHLSALRALTRPGGELVLETLIAPQLASGSLPINGRYARMRNLWELPSVACLEGWLRRAGLQDVRTVSISETHTDEQRRTGWMPYDSLAQALDPARPALTIEGYPRPCRAVLLATC